MTRTKWTAFPHPETAALPGPVSPRMEAFG